MRKDKYSSEEILIKPQVLFLGGLVDPVTEVIFRFVILPDKALGFAPSAILPAHIVDFDLIRP
jgi:hypothetical protein